MNYTITILNEVWCQLSNLPQNVQSRLSDEFAIYVDGYFFMPQYQEKIWDGKKRFYHINGKTFIRLLPRVVSFLESIGYKDYNLIDNRKDVIDLPENYTIVPDIFGDIKVNGNPFLLRPYQVEDLQKLINNRGGLAILGTGYGKTSLTAVLSHLHSSGENQKSITIVPSISLVTQTANWYKLLGLDTGIYSGTEKDLNHKNIVSTWQSLQNNPQILSSGFGFNAVIYDECHGAKADVSSKLLNDYGFDIPFRYGVTGTLPKSKVESEAIKLTLGDIVCERPTSWLIDHGWLAKVDIQPIEIQDNVEEDFPDYASERSFINKNPSRMEKIADLIIAAQIQYGNTLVLINDISFGKKLTKLIKNSHFIYGDDNDEVRQELYKRFDGEDNLIVIASSGIASTGISIDRIFCLISVDAGKSFIRSIQSVGRGLRKNKDKIYLMFLDIYSKLHWSKKHYKDREKYYKEAKYPIMKVNKIKIQKKTNKNSILDE